MSILVQQCRENVPHLPSCGIILRQQRLHAIVRRARRPVVPPLTPRCSPEAFVQETLRLLELERTSEELQSLAARGSCSPKEQEAAGLALRRMNIAAVEHGAGGRVYLRFEKYMQQVHGHRVAASCIPLKRFVRYR